MTKFSRLQLPGYKYGISTELAEQFIANRVEQNNQIFIEKLKTEAADKNISVEEPNPNE